LFALWRGSELENMDQIYNVWSVIVRVPGHSLWDIGVWLFREVTFILE